METPILDFLREYEKKNMSRLHMPGHKGIGPLGCEGWDITEVKGADSLYEAEGIIARSETNAARLFGSGRTLYSTEGSSQCIRAMLALALQNRPAGSGPVVLAGRNAHRSFLSAAALLDLEVEWLWPEGEGRSLCSCPITPEGLEGELSAMERPPFAVYITSPDYLGGRADIAALGEVCHRRGIPLLVDNAHGAYLHFLEKPCHPLDLGADLCCDSAHKTLPVLTGGAYLHVSPNAPKGMGEGARGVMALFGSTSPSYLTLASLDGCNGWLAEEGPGRIRGTAEGLAGVKAKLLQQGWRLWGEEPLKLTVDAAASGWRGDELGELLRAGGVEPEFADRDYVVLMASGNTRGEELQRLAEAFARGRPQPGEPVAAPALTRGKRVMSIRQAMLSPQEELTVEECVGRVCAAPTVSCPPAVPILVCGEVVDEAAVERFRYYGIDRCVVIK
ncbi:MAG: amino acid decarboxylase [Oscillospiraceae bacterium]|nr:amino acid decarboxylase [Oscillospiraceae bacterium]